MKPKSILLCCTLLFLMAGMVGCEKTNHGFPSPPTPCDTCNSSKACDTVPAAIARHWTLEGFAFGTFKPLAPTACDSCFSLVISPDGTMRGRTVANTLQGRICCKDDSLRWLVYATTEANESHPDALLFSEQLRAIRKWTIDADGKLRLYVSEQSYLQFRPQASCACSTVNPTTQLPWLATLIQKAESDQTGNYRGHIWFERHNGQDLFAVEMPLGSGHTCCHLYDCRGNRYHDESQVTVTRSQLLYTNQADLLIRGRWRLVKSDISDGTPSAPKEVEDGYTITFGPGDQFSANLLSCQGEPIAQLRLIDFSSFRAIILE